MIAGEPRTAISLNQWRNIAAHRSFRCIGPELVEVSFGAGPEPYVRVLTIEDVSETMDWAMKLHSVLKLAVDLLIIDEAEHLHGVGGPPPAVRVDGWLVQIRHSLALQGYRGAAWGVAGDTIGLDLVDTRADRDLQTAIIHSSQVLDQLAYAALRDPIYAGQVKWAVVRIVSDDGKTRARAGARVTVHDAIECVEGRLDMTGLLHRTEFAFAPAEVLAGWLPRGLPVRRYTATRSC